MENGYLTSFKGKQVDLFDYEGRPIRRFITQAEVVNATVSGAGKNATVAITMKGGKYVVYKADGTMIRRNH